MKGYLYNKNTKKHTRKAMPNTSEQVNLTKHVKIYPKITRGNKSYFAQINHMLCFNFSPFKKAFSIQQSQCVFYLFVYL